MVKLYTGISCAVFLSIFGNLSANAKVDKFDACKSATLALKTDTSKKIGTDTIGQMVKALQKFKQVRDTLDLAKLAAVPNLSLQQMAKGNLPGVYVQEPNGEPGTEQSMIVQGPSGILFSKKDIYNLQPAVYLNGVPLVADNPFAFDIQKYDYNRIGPATNLLAQLNINNIQSIAVVKDPVELAKLGPNAANGAIYITTKNAKAGNQDISLNSYFGYVTSPKVNTINGAYERDFRAPFYQKWATAEDNNNYASYLKDSTNTTYFGPSNWNTLYYQDRPVVSADLGITGGSERANFRFFGSGTKNAGNADDTSLNRYNLFFGLNMAPFKWLTVSSNVNAVLMDRDRNKSLRDRYAEARYIPDLSSPLSPNADIYATYLTELEKSVDRNRSIALNGNLGLTANLKKIVLSSNLLFNYNEGKRDYFTPSTIMEGVSYVSNYFGFSQRVAINNFASYKFEINKDHQVDAQVGLDFQGDTYKYNYARAYNGPNDFIKINVVPGTGDDYLNTLASGGFYVFRYDDRMRNNLMSFYGSLKYTFKDLLTLNAILRRDGASNGQPDSRWVTTPSFSATWNLKNQFLTGDSFINDLKLSAGWGRVMRLFNDDRYAAGPQYRSENGWFEEPTIPGYGGRLGINRPYDSGFVGYGLPMPYADRTYLSLASTFLDHKMNVAVTLYNRNDKNGVVLRPTPQEQGYAGIYQSGMEINNKGAELNLSAMLVENPKAFSWSTGLNLSYNHNELSALPGGVKQLVYQNDKLVVGKPVGSFWLYTNNGIYNTDAEVPSNPNTGEKMTFNGIPLKAGDPRWVDHNNDYRIDDEDKVLTGNRLPNVVGGWNNTLSYKSFDLNFNFIFAAGQKAINQFDATRYGFVNREAGNDINSIKEVSSWQYSDQAKTYPIYNPWSSVDAYRADQDLFLEDASYLKLRSVTLGYDFAKGLLKLKSLRKAYLYATALNVFTVTKFSGVDPELINVNGYYDGANISIPRTFVLGLKLDL